MNHKQTCVPPPAPYISTVSCFIIGFCSYFLKGSKEKEIADGEEKKVANINEKVSKKQRDCERDLAKAEPALQAAAAALNTLNKVRIHVGSNQGAM